MSIGLVLTRVAWAPACARGGSRNGDFAEDARDPPPGSDARSRRGASAFFARVRRQMEFLRACAARLDDGALASDVMRDLRSQYTTLPCLSSKLSLVRSLCRPSSDFVAAVDAACDGVEDADEREALRAAALAGSRLPPGLRCHAVDFPPRLSSNARARSASRWRRSASATMPPRARRAQEPRARGGRRRGALAHARGDRAPRGGARRDPRVDARAHARDGTARVRTAQRTERVDRGGGVRGCASRDRQKNGTRPSTSASRASSRASPAARRWSRASPSCARASAARFSRTRRRAAVSELALAAHGDRGRRGRARGRACTRSAACTRACVCVSSTGRPCRTRTPRCASSDTAGSPSRSSTLPRARRRVRARVRARARAPHGAFGGTGAGGTISVGSSMSRRSDSGVGAGVALCTVAMRRTLGGTVPLLPVSDPSSRRRSFSPPPTCAPT